MRHSWADISANVCICRHCGMKRVETKTRYHAHSKPLMTYTRDDMMQTSAGNCVNIWPDHIHPEYRVSYYKEPAQERLVFSEEDCPGHVASNDDPRVCARCGVHIRSLAPPDEYDGPTIDLEPSNWALDHDMDDDIPF